MKRKLSLCLILVLFITLRSWRINKDLLIHYDQGRDLLASYQIWKLHRPTLIGPTTDTPGVFVGPFYYYLISIPLFITHGHPVSAIVFLQLIELFSVYLLFLGAESLFGYQTAIASIIFISTSYSMVSFSRWLSNAFPVMIAGNILFFLLAKILKGRTNLFSIAFFVAGIAWQSDPAVGVGFLPFLLTLSLILEKISIKRIFFHLTYFLIPAIPQVIFEFRHQFLVTNNLIRFFLSQKEGIGLSSLTIRSTSEHYFRFQNSLIAEKIRLLPTAVSILGLLSFVKLRLYKKKKWLFPFLFILTHIVTLYFFKRGVFEFFYIGIAGGLIVFLTAVLIKVSPKIATISGSLLVIYNLILSAKGFATPGVNLIPIGTANVVTLENRLIMIKFLNESTENAPFSLWTYTIPYYQDEAWKYLWLWKNIPQPVDKGKYLYTLSERDWDKPYRLDDWQKKVDGVSLPITSLSAGNFKIEKRSWK